jgi:NAD(P)-dependent dehydrogenase (short-subunit alcohol dehydrogenase family)
MRTVFVTGAAHGMGLAAARAFASDGDRIFLYVLGSRFFLDGPLPYRG